MSKGDAGFGKIMYKGKPLTVLKATSAHTIVMQKSNPDRLDMRFKCNREFLDKLKVKP